MIDLTVDMRDSENDDHPLPAPIALSNNEIAADRHPGLVACFKSPTADQQDVFIESMPGWTDQLNILHHTRLALTDPNIEVYLHDDFPYNEVTVPSAELRRLALKGPPKGPVLTIEYASLGDLHFPPGPENKVSPQLSLLERGRARLRVFIVGGTRALRKFQAIGRWDPYGSIGVIEDEKWSDRRVLGEYVAKWITIAAEIHRFDEAKKLRLDYVVDEQNDSSELTFVLFVSDPNQMDDDVRSPITFKNGRISIEQNLLQAFADGARRAGVPVGALCGVEFVLAGIGEVSAFSKAQALSSNQVDVFAWATMPTSFFDEWIRVKKRR